MSESDVTRQHLSRLAAAHAPRLAYVDHRADLDGRSPEPLIQVVVLEVMRGDASEFGLLQELAREPVAVVAMVSVFRADHARRSLQLGATSWVLPGLTGSELVTAVEAAASICAQVRLAAPGAPAS